jgi:hypothetical protein
MSKPVPMNTVMTMGWRALSAEGHQKQDRQTGSRDHADHSGNWPTTGRQRLNAFDLAGHASGLVLPTRSDRWSCCEPSLRPCRGPARRGSGTYQRFRSQYQNSPQSRVRTSAIDHQARRFIIRTLATPAHGLEPGSVVVLHRCQVRRGHSSGASRRPCTCGCDTLTRVTDRYGHESNFTGS